MPDANRKFREEVPQPKATDVCPNYCHNETARKLTHNLQWDEFDKIDVLATSRFHKPLMGQSRNGILGIGEYEPILSRTDRRRRPWSNTGALSDAYAKGGGDVFQALRITDPDKGTAVMVDLQWESQDFRGAATDWEKQYCPLVNRRTASKGMTPVVDTEGYVIAYTDTAHPSYLWRTADNSIVYLPDINGQHAKDQAKAKALQRRGWRYVSGGDYARILVNVDGQVLHYGISDRALEPPDFLPSLILSLGGSLLLGLLKSGVRTLFLRITRGGTSGMAKSLGQAGEELTVKEARELVKQLRNEGKEVVINVGGEAAEHEVKVWPHAINVNTVTKGRRLDIPNLLRRSGEELDAAFLPETIDKVVSSKLPTSVDPEKLARATVKVLRKRGGIEINVFGSGVEKWTSDFANALAKLGIKPSNIKNISDVLVMATK